MTIYVEDVNYWKTSTSAADTWIERAKKEIEAIDGSILSEAYGNQGDRAAFMLLFEIAGDTFKAIWPVLESETGNQKAAKIQAATMLYHDVKAKCVSAKVLGARKAFFGFMLLSDGRVASETGGNEIAALVPPMLMANVNN